MNLGISTACFYPERLEDTIAQIAAQGIRHAEIFINTESEFTHAYCRTLREKLDFYGVQAVSVHPFTSPMEGLLLLSDYERRTEDALRQYDSYFGALEILGARYFTFHGERSIIRDADERVLARKTGVYNRLCEVAGAHGVMVAQENVAWCKSENPEYLRLLYDRVPNLRFTLDIKQAHRAERHWTRYLDVMGERLVNVHINDFDETHSCMLPGEGMMDYGAFFERLAALGYDRQVLIEVYRSNFEDDKQLKKSVSHLQKAIANMTKQ